MTFNLWLHARSNPKFNSECEYMHFNCDIITNIITLTDMYVYVHPFSPAPVNLADCRLFIPFYSFLIFPIPLFSTILLWSGFIAYYSVSYILLYSDLFLRKVVFFSDMRWKKKKVKLKMRDVNSEFWLSRNSRFFFWILRLHLAILFFFLFLPWNNKKNI